MKRITSLILVFTILISFCGCQGNFGSVNLNDSVSIPEDGFIKESILKQIKKENAIGVFTGESNGIQYEWTIFGSDIVTPKQLNLAVDITQTINGYPKVILRTTESFGFAALLSVYWDEVWNAQSATGYANDKAVASVSLTGSKSAILNMMLDGSCTTLIIRPDALPEEAYTEVNETTQDKTESLVTEDDYLSGYKESDTTVSSNTPGTTTGSTNQTVNNDDYLSGSKENNNEVYTGGKDQYLTDPVPEGKPNPVEPENQDVDKGTSYTCTFSIECSTILNNLDMLDPDKLEMVPSGGVILSKTTVTFYEGESVFDVLQRVCKEKGIHMEAEWTPIYNSAYIEGIHNLYEFDCGALSGWMYKVNGWYPNYGSSRYQLKDGDVVEWRFTCDLGNDVGGGYAVGG